jgi:protein O-GlcNAc transferase
MVTVSELEILQRGVAYHQAGKLEQAADCYRQLIQRQPLHPQAMQLLGVVALQQGDFDQAISRIGQAIQQQPDQPDFYCNLGLALIQRGRLDEAVAILRQGVERQPTMAELFFNLGIAHQQAGDLNQAAFAYERAVALDPAAIEYLASAVHLRQQFCDWRGLEEAAQAIIAWNDFHAESERTSLSPFTFLSLPLPTSAAQQWRCARRWTGGLQPPTAHRYSTPPRATAEPTRSRLRIGYLSADFRDHPVGWLLPELWESHDRQGFQIFGYALHPDDGSAIGRRLQEGCDTYRYLDSYSWAEAARAIAADGIDILIDLTGHTRHARPEILAYRPAPLQLSYLGYASTMGADFIDYAIVDRYVVPLAQQAFYSERLLQLPRCFLVQDGKAERAKPLTRAELGLPEEARVLCAFGAYFKITPSIFSEWMACLQAEPKAVLWLRSGPAVAMERLRQAAQAAGIRPERLIFAPLVPRPEHLARHAAADLFVDTFPYNQHSTAADALRAGVPLVTISGDTFASRVAGSLLTELGLEELITRDLLAYATLIQQLLHQPERLSALRSRLAATIPNSPLFSGRAFARMLEDALVAIWLRHRQQLPPAPIAMVEEGGAV